MSGRTTSPAERIRLADGVVSEASGERQVVLNAEGTMIHTVNPVGASILGLLPMGRDDILADLVHRYPDVDREQLADDLDGFIDELTDAGLIARSDADG